MRKTLIIDIDGTLCEERRTFERPLAEPLPGAAQALRELQQRWVIILYTARSWAEYEVTKDWLDRHGMVYDVLQCGKPIGDVWIDDRTISYHPLFNPWSSIVTDLRKGVR